MAGAGLGTAGLAAAGTGLAGTGFGGAGADWAKMVPAMRIPPRIQRALISTSLPGGGKEFPESLTAVRGRVSVET